MIATKIKTISLGLTIAAAIGAASFFWIKTVDAVGAKPQTNQKLAANEKKIQKNTPKSQTFKTIFDTQIVLETYKIEENQLEHRDNLGNALKKYHVDSTAIATLYLDSKLNKQLAKGSYYTAVVNRSTDKLQYFFYQSESTHYHKIKFEKDTVVSQKINKTIELRERQVGAMVGSSLYQSLDVIEADRKIADKFIAIFSYTVDFFHLRKGDFYRIIFDEKYIDGRYIGFGNIRAVQFNHKGQDFFAFLFDDGETTEYYNAGGEIMKKTFLKAPLDFSRISSKYTLKRFHPVQKIFKPHLGTDYAAPAGTPVKAVADGKIIAAEFGIYNGNYVKIEHNKKHTTQYLHFSRIAKGIKRNTTVKQGQTIGYVGSTGLASGPHLCFRFWENGKQIDGQKITVVEKLPLVRRDKKIEFYNLTNQLMPLFANIVIQQKDDHKPIETQKNTALTNTKPTPRQGR